MSCLSKSITITKNALESAWRPERYLKITRSKPYQSGSQALFAGQDGRNDTLYPTIRRLLFGKSSKRGMGSITTKSDVSILDAQSKQSFSVC